MHCCYTFGQWLRDARNAAGFSLRQLGHLARCNYSYLARLEQGRHATPSRDMVMRIASALNASVPEALVAAGYQPADVMYPEIVVNMLRGDPAIGAHEVEAVRRFYLRVRTNRNSS